MLLVYQILNDLLPNLEQQDRFYSGVQALQTLRANQWSFSSLSQCQDMAHDKLTLCSYTVAQAEFPRCLFGSLSFGSGKPNGSWRKEKQ